MRQRKPGVWTKTGVIYDAESRLEAQMVSFRASIAIFKGSTETEQQRATDYEESERASPPTRPSGHRATEHGTGHTQVTSPPSLAEAFLK